MRRLAGFFVALVSLFAAAPAFAVWPLPAYSEYPCSGAVSPPENCQNQAGDPAIHRQSKLSERSVTVGNACPLTPDPFGGFCWGGGCTSTAGYCRKPSILSATAPTVEVLHDGPYLTFDVEYDFPNNYCQLDLQSNQTSSWWPLIYNDIHLTRLQIIVGNSVVAESMAVFEHGRWTPRIKAGCGITEYKVRVITKCFEGLEDTRSFTVIVDPEKCGSDKDSCPLSVSKPVNVGSGDVTYSERLFSIDQEPSPLVFMLSYHSERPINPQLGRYPLGPGWTHNFNQSLRPIDRDSNFVQMTIGDGREVIFQKSGSAWNAVRPRQWRGRVTLDGAQTHFLYTDQSGNVTAFDRTTGLWTSSADRWGNTISGGYTGNDLTAITDSEGRVVSLAYTGGLLSTISLPGGALWRFEYSGGALTKIFDPVHTGSTAWRTFAYQPDSHGTLRMLTEVRDESALLEGHTYDAQDRGTGVVTGNGREAVTIAYDQPGAATTVTHAIDGAQTQVSHFSLIYQGGRYLADHIQGSCATCSAASSDDQTFQYDGFNHVLSTTDANGHTTRFTYNGDGNMLRKIEAFGTSIERTTTYEYGNPAWPDFVTKIVEPSAAKPGAQKTTTFAWSNNETIFTVATTGYLRAGDAGPVTFTTTTTFDARHREISTDGPRTDVADVVTRTLFPDNDANVNRRGRVQQQRDAAGLITSSDDYDVYGTARSVTDPNGVRRVVVTDARGRLVTRTNKAVAGDPNEAADYVETMTFDGRDRLTARQSARGFTQRWAYEDGTNRNTDRVLLDAAGNEVERRHFTLNDIGSVVREEDQSCASPALTCASWVTKRSFSSVYDTHNRLSQQIQADGSTRFLTWDADGLLRTVRDEGHATANLTYGYDALHRISSVSRKLGGGSLVSSFTYDAAGNLASATDANGNVTAWTYDDFGRIQTTTNPATGTRSNTYDPAGNLVTATDASGASTARTYDARNRQLTATSTRGGSPSETITWTWDGGAASAYGKGRITSVSDPTGSMTYSYDRRGLLRGEGHSVQGNAYSFAYRYDADGNRSSITYPSGRVVNYTFDHAGRPLSATSGATTYVSNARYLPFGPMTSLDYGNGTARSTSYDSRYRMTGNALSGPLGPIAGYAYGYDATGNIASIHDQLDPAFNRDFGYDDLDRLTRANTGQSLWGAGSFSYDAMGNMLTMSLGPSRQSSFTYDGALPKLASATENGLTRPVTYDAAGNETTVGAGSFSYSARNLLASADGLAYAYDSRGLRTISTVTSALGTLTGNVTTLGGAPVIGATVTVDGTLNSTSTDAGGNFSLNQGAGTFTMTVMKQGFVPETSTSFTLAAGATVNVGTIKLGVAPSVISGTVVSSLGFALNGATVAIGTGSTTTDTNGNFSLTQPAGTYSAAISAPGYTPQTTASFTTQPGDLKSLGTITLTAIPATISGRVVSSTGGAVSGATVTANGTPLGSSLVMRGADVSSAQKSGRGRPLPIATDAFSQSTNTDGSGNFSLQLPAGTYTLSITKNGFAGTTTGSINVGPGTTYATGDVTVDPLGTITGVVVAKSTLAPVSGATVAIVGSLNTTTTDANGRFTVQQPPGSYAIQITATGFAQLSTDVFALGPGQTHDAGTLQLPPVALSVYVGYADDLRPSSTFPTPWAGSPNVVFIGSGSPIDAGAVRLDNNTDEPMSVNGVTVDLGRPGPSFNLWGSFVVPAHGTVILTQTAQFNFDTSDYPITNCDQLPLANDPRVPRVTVNIGGNATTYFDTGHILDTGGFDLACKANESLQWRLIGTTGINANGDFLLAPPTGTATLGSSYTVTATATDANGQPLSNVNVTFRVISGPNIGRTGTSLTNASGQATFSYTGTAAGTDTLQATITNASGGSLTSNPVSVTWPAFSNIEVFVGYADDLRPAPSFPTPWRNSPNVVFIGSGSPYDAGAVRIDNESDQQIHIDKVVVDMQRPSPVFDLWGAFNIPAHGTAILTQTTQYNFDTSEFTIVPCHGVVLPTDPRVSKITVTMNGQSASYLDTAHILDTFGYDLADCPANTNESLQWRPVGTTSQVTNGRLSLLPLTATTIVNSSYTATAVATDAGNEPIANVPIDFRVVTGPNTGKTGRVTTNGSGIATFSYTSTVTGTDTVRASITNSSGGVLNSNDVKSIWVSTAAVSLAPPSATHATGTIHNVIATVTDGAGSPLANMNVTFRITAGPNTGKTGSGISVVNGTVNFAYTSSVPGTDTIVASVIGAGGNSIQSNAVIATWEAPVSIALAPATATQQLGSTYTATATVTSGGSPANGASVTFTVLAGPNAPRTATSTTNAAGQATFSYTGAALGTDFIQATSGSATSNQVTVKWTNIPTALQFLGSYGAEYNDPQTFSAKLTEALNGTPIVNQSVVFDLGGQIAGGTTDAAGIASVVITPAGVPGPTPMSVTFAATGPYTAANANAVVSVVRDETAIQYTGGTLVPNGVAQTVSALLTDPDGGAPIAGRTITFTIGGVTVSAVTNAAGVATTTINVPPSLGTGPVRMYVVFAGDAYYVPAETSVPVILFAPSSFVIWGGNATPPHVGQKVNFWGSQWPKQVTGGDYDNKADLKGYVTLANPPLAQICEPAARQNGTPRLDDKCWTSRPGDSDPPAQLDRYIGVIVSTSIAKQGSEIYGNTAAIVVLRVETVPQYGSDPGLPGYGTIAGVYADGANLFALNAPAPAVTADASFLFRHVTKPRRTPVTRLVSLVNDFEGVAIFDFAAFSTATTYANVLKPAPMTVSAGNRRYSFYSPEMNLLAETGLSAGNGAPPIGYEYIWFNGQPVAQVDVGVATHWTFTDHLGTPILQTDAAGAVYWRAEYEPFGAIYALRSADQHQPLRFPGQEAEQLNLGANGVTEREYNVFRWYRSAWGRYTQADPVGVRGGANLFGYGLDNPISNQDPLGLKVRTCCKIIPATLIGKRHCYFEFDSGPPYTIGFHFDNEENPMETVWAIVGLQLARVKYDHGFDTDTTNPGTCGPWNKCADSCVLKAAASYGVKQYYLFGPNSNTFAAYITYLCGLTPPNPQETENAPGWYTPPPQVPYAPWSDVVDAYNKVSKK